MCHIGQMNFTDLPVKDDHIYPQEEANSLNGIIPPHCICTWSICEFVVIFGAHQTHQTHQQDLKQSSF